MKNCPNCGFQNDPTTTECSKCGIIFEKWTTVKEAEKKAISSEKKSDKKTEDEAEQLRREWETKKEAIAKKVKSGSFSGGLEDKLEKIGLFFAYLSAISLIVGVVLGFAKGIEYGPFWVGIGITGFIQGLIAAVLFEGGAEVIRLLKKLNGLPYGGRISTSKPLLYVTKCSVCGLKLSESDKFCPRCGRVFGD